MTQRHMIKSDVLERVLIWGVGLVSGALLVLILALFAINLEPASRRIGAHLAELATDRIGRPVSCQSFRFRPWRLELKDVQVRGDARFSLNLGKVVLYPEVSDLLSGHLKLRQVVGEDLELVLSLPAKEAQREPRASEPDRSTTNPVTALWSEVIEPLEPYLVQRDFAVSLQNGRIQLDTNGERHELVRIEQWTVRWPDTSLPGVHSEFDIRGSSEDETLLGALDAPSPSEPLVLELSGPGLSMERLRQPLLAVAPAGLEEQIRGVMEKVTNAPSIGGNFTVRLNLDEQTASIDGDINVRDLYVRDERLLAEPVGPLDLEQTVAVRIELRPFKLNIREWLGNINGVEYRLSGFLEHEEEALPISAELELDKVKYQDLVEAVPGEMIPALKGVRLGGSIDLSLQVRGDLRKPRLLEADFSADWSRFWLERPSDLLKGGAPLHGSTHLAYSRTGVARKIVLGRVATGWVPIEDIPNALVHALLVSEDINFFHHEGFDLEGLKAALQENLEAGRLVRGGSTITQQLAKNLFLSRERTVSRKLQEAILAVQLERILGKKHILEYYLNIIEWGPGVFGVSRASQYYFNKSPGDLTVLESAFLCSIIPAPIKYHVYFVRGSLSVKWRDQVDQLLSRLRLYEYITEEEYQRALDERLEFRRPTRREDGAGLGQWSFTEQ